MADGDLPIEQLIAPVYGALYWLLYYEVGRDLFPGVPVHSYSASQDQAVANRAVALVEVGRKQIVRPTPPPSDPRPPASRD
jgi:hypothetical protein